MLAKQLAAPSRSLPLAASPSEGGGNPSERDLFGGALGLVLRMTISCNMPCPRSSWFPGDGMQLVTWRLSPENTADLDTSERLLLRSFRRWTSGIAQGDARSLEAAWSELAVALGPGRARLVLDALSSLVFRLAGAARRVIRHHHPCCPNLTSDERRLIALVAACQLGRRAVARSAAVQAVGADVVEPFLDGAIRLADAFAAAGQRLPDRGDVIPAALALDHAERRTIH